MKFNYAVLSKDTGANLYEYLLLLLLICMIAIPSVQYFGDNTHGRFQQTDDAWELYVAPTGFGPG